jgi:D-arabinose 1-dehydrogenase-like Zn-dependent alcohol dehydrogenase
LVRDLGADVVVARGERFAEAVRAEMPAGVDAVVDGAVLDDGALHAVRDGGRMVSLRGYDGAGAARRGVEVIPVYVRTCARERTKLERLRAQAEDGTLTLRVADVLPAEEAGDAHRRLERGGERGRIVLEF